MEESSFLLKLKFIFKLLCTETVSSLSVSSLDPLFSCIVTFCTLILLYLPHLYWKIVFSPVLILSGVILLVILRLGAIQKSEKEKPGKTELIGNEENRGNREEKQGNFVEPVEADSLDQIQRSVAYNSEVEFISEVGFESSSYFDESFVEWNVKAPLEVIHTEPIGNEENRGNREEKQGNSVEQVEADSLHQIQLCVACNSEIEVDSEVGVESSSRFDESFVEWNVKAPLEVIYEGEETEQEPNEKQDMTTGIWRYPSLSQYYPESDSDSSSESGFPAMVNWDSPENMCLRWDEEDREGLIEIVLDGGKNKASGFQFEEENLIEIDISPTRHREFPGDDEMFSGEISCN